MNGPPPPRLVASVYLQFIAQDGQIRFEPYMFVPPVALPLVASALEQLAKRLREDVPRIVRPGD